VSGRYTLSPRAQLDLEGIWDHTEKRWGIAKAEEYTIQLWRQIEAVADNPASGRECAEIRAGYFKYRSGSHFLFYRLTEAGIDIVRILHERMDFPRHL
jgi:toxin ParE1/3/4